MYRDVRDFQQDLFAHRFGGGSDMMHTEHQHVRDRQRAHLGPHDEFHAGDNTMYQDVRDRQPAHLGPRDEFRAGGNTMQDVRKHQQDLGAHRFGGGSDMTHTEYQHLGDHQDHQGHHDEFGADGEDDSDMYDGDVTIMPYHDKSSELEHNPGPSTGSILSGIEFGLGGPRGHTIPTNQDSVINYYNAKDKSKSKRDRELSDHEHSESVESRQSKISRRSTSHSTAQSAGPSVPATTEANSSREQSVSPDRQGASRITGGKCRGRAAGNYVNMADTGKSLFIFLFLIG